MRGVAASAVHHPREVIYGSVGAKCAACRWPAHGVGSLVSMTDPAAQRRGELSSRLIPVSRRVVPADVSVDGPRTQDRLRLPPGAVRSPGPRCGTPDEPAPGSPVPPVRADRPGWSGYLLARYWSGTGRMTEQSGCSPTANRPQRRTPQHRGNACDEPPGQLPHQAVSGRYCLFGAHHDPGFGFGGFPAKKRKVPRDPLWAEEHGPRVRHLQSA